MLSTMLDHQLALPPQSRSTARSLRFNGAAVVMFIVLLVVLQRFLKVYRSPLLKIPGPWYARWTDLRLRIETMRGRNMFYIHDLHQQYGPYVLIAPNEVSVSSSAGLSEIHRVGSKFQKSPWYQEFTNLDREVLFTTRDPKVHAQRRKLFSRPFSKNSMHENWESFVQERVRFAVSQIKSNASKGSTDVLYWLSLMANDVSSMVIYGDCFHLLEKGQFNEHILAIKATFMSAAVNAQFPIVYFLAKCFSFIGPIKKYVNQKNTLVEYGSNAARHARSNDSKHMLAHMIQAVEKEDNHGLSETDIIYDATGFLTAGTDTTSTSLTFIIWAALAHPEWRQRLEREVDELPEGFGVNDVETLPVLNAILDESLRLYGAAPGGLPRAVPAGGVNIEGYHFDEGTILTTQAYTYHRDPILFPNPEQFDPSRWLPTDKLEGSNIQDNKVSAAARAVFHPFGLGSRACLGMHLAKMELRFGMAEFFREMKGVKLSPSTTAESMKMVNWFVAQPVGEKCEVEF